MFLPAKCVEQQEDILKQQKLATEEAVHDVVDNDNDVVMDDQIPTTIVEHLDPGVNLATVEPQVEKDEEMSSELPAT